MGINRIKNRAEFEVGEREYELTIRDLKKDEVIYQETSHGGVLCSVEQVTQIEKGDVEGVHQTVAWGNPMVQFYAADQVARWFKEVFPQMIKEFQRVGQLQSNIDLSTLFKK